MRSYWKTFELVLISFLIFTACETHKKPAKQADLQNFIAQHSLAEYEYLFIIHISPHDCLGCLHPLEQLNKLQERINANGQNTLIVITSEDNEAFWRIYNSFQLAVTFIKEEELASLNWPGFNATPYGYFYDLKKRRLIYRDTLPKEQVTFLALANLVEKYSGILF